MFYGRFKDGVDDVRILKVDFSFGRVDVDINKFRIDVYLHEIHGVSVSRNQFLICGFDGMFEVRMLHVSSVDEEILVSVFSFFGSFRLADES